MQYKIPQNVGIEDKIVGPLSLRQLIILAVGFGISYVLFAILSKIYELNVLEYIIIVLPGLLSAAFAMIRINDISLTKFFFLFLEFSIKPKKRVWDHRGISNLVSPDLNTNDLKNDNDLLGESPLERKARQAANLNELTKALDSDSFAHIKESKNHDIDLAKDDDLVTHAYFGHQDSETDNMYWRTKESHLKMLEVFAKLPITELKKGTPETEIAQKEILKIKKEVENNHQPKKSNTKEVQLNEEEIKANNKNKSRKRSRPLPKPVRKNQQINSLEKKKPVQYQKPIQPKKSAHPKNSKPENKNKAQPTQNKKNSPLFGEFDLRELSEGDSIEINLD